MWCHAHDDVERFAAADAVDYLQGAVAAGQVLADIKQRVRAAFDPRGVFV